MRHFGSGVVLAGIGMGLGGYAEHVLDFESKYRQKERLRYSPEYRENKTSDCQIKRVLNV